jgi:hypothetical protein
LPGIAFSKVVVAPKRMYPVTVDNYGTKFPNVAETIWAKVDE